MPVGNHKAGMSKNPFGGYDRLDKCNLQGPSILGGLLIDVFSDVPGERTMICKMFLDDCNNYVNSPSQRRTAPSLDQFIYASEFLLRVRLPSRRRGKAHVSCETTYFDEYLGRRVTRAAGVDGRPNFVWAVRIICWGSWRCDGVRGLHRCFFEPNAQENPEEPANRSMSSIALMNSSSLSRNILHKETIPLKAFEPVSGRYI